MPNENNLVRCPKWETCKTEYPELCEHYAPHERKEYCGKIVGVIIGANHCAECVPSLPERTEKCGVSQCSLGTGDLVCAGWSLGGVCNEPGDCKHKFTPKPPTPPSAPGDGNIGFRLQPPEAPDSKTAQEMILKELSRNQPTPPSAPGEGLTYTDKKSPEKEGREAAQELMGKPSEGKCPLSQTCPDYKESATQPRNVSGCGGACNAPAQNDGGQEGRVDAKYIKLLEEIRETLARGYCDPLNDFKSVDSTLIDAMAYEVLQLIFRREQTAREDERKKIAKELDSFSELWRGGEMEKIITGGSK